MAGIPGTRAPLVVVALGDPERRDDAIAQRVMGRVRTLIGEIGCTRARSRRPGAGGTGIVGSHEGAPRGGGADLFRSRHGRGGYGSGRADGTNRGAGLAAAQPPAGAFFEWIEGGSDPRALDPLLGDRKRVVLMDAVRLHGAPGTVHHWHLGCPAVSGLSTVRVFNGKKLGLDHLGLWLEDELPPCGTDLIGIEPADLSEGEGLSDPLARKLPTICAQVAAILVRILEEEGW